MSKTKKAFTLVEFAVVIAIVATLLLILTSATTLINNSKIKTLYKEVNNLTTAINNFKLTYNALPGDFKDGYKFFNSVASCVDELPNSNPASDYPDQGCNGDGDGLWDADLYNTGGTGYCCFAEGYLMWQHLSMAKLIKNPTSGSYTGYKIDATAKSTQQNLYELKALSGALILPLDSWSSGLNHPNSKGNKLRIGRFTAEFFAADEGILTSEIAYSFDLKFDDGKPKTGFINSYNFYDIVDGYDGFSEIAKDCTSLENNNSATTTQLEAATYNYTNKTAKSCMLEILYN